MCSNIMKTQSVLRTAKALQRPEFQRQTVAMRLEASARDRSEYAICRVAQEGTASNAIHAVPDSDVVAHPLNLRVPSFINPGKALKLWIEIRPFFERLRFLQSHCQSAFEIRSARVRRVDVAVELGV